MDLGRHAGAVINFTSLLEYRPDDALAYYYRALAHTAMGELLCAAWDFVLACDLASDFLEARYNLACMYARMGNFEQAQAELQVVNDSDLSVFSRTKSWLEKGKWHMLPKKPWVVTVPLAVILVIVVSGVVTTLAQEEGDCDIDALIEHQQEHAATLESLEHMLHDDLDSALETLYVTGIAYQALAVDCGFGRTEEVAGEHAAEHETEADHDDEDHDAGAILEAAMLIGNPENGELLFNEFQPEVSFSCATCHRVDSTERLIGPGLWGVGNPDHDPSEHDMGAMDMGGTMDHADGGHDETDTGDEMDHSEETDHAMDTGDSQTDDHMMDMGDAASSDPVEYIRTSILDPSAFIVPGFPDNLMPNTYGEIFTEDEINDLIAYLLTLQ